jgi:hypothetical protein
MMIRTCVQCGREFEARHAAERLCNSECRRKRRGEAQRANREHAKQLHAEGRKIRKEWHNSK